MVAIIPAYFLLYNYFELYQSFRYRSLVSEITQIVKANILGVLFVFVLLFMLKEVHVSRMVITLFAIFNTIITSIARIFIRKFLRHLRRKGYNLKKVLIVGSVSYTHLDVYKRQELRLLQQPMKNWKKQLQN